MAEPVWPSWLPRAEGGIGGRPVGSHYRIPKAKEPARASALDLTSKGIAFLGTDELRQQINTLMADIPAIVMVEGLEAAADIIRAALESATPVGGTYVYHRKEGGKAIVFRDPHPGRARASTIVYRRKGGTTFGRYAQAQSVAAFLVGYNRPRAYYMYWREYGRVNQPARPFVRAAYDSAEGPALEAATQLISAIMGG